MPAWLFELHVLFSSVLLIDDEYEVILMPLELFEHVLSLRVLLDESTNKMPVPQKRFELQVLFMSILLNEESSSMPLSLFEQELFEIMLLNEEDNLMPSLVFEEQLLSRIVLSEEVFRKIP